MTMAVTGQSGASSSNVDTAKIIIIEKNARCLSGDAPIEEILQDLAGEAWDLVIVNETWRDAKEECFKVDAGHVWFGSGGQAKRGVKGWKHGVGILLHRRWARAWSNMNAVSPQLLWIDLKIHRVKLRIMSAYMPHSGYPDSEAEGTYCRMDAAIREARINHKLLVIGGDWNAEVGRQKIGEESNVAVGKHGMGERNTRGQWFATWAMTSNLVVANTLFRKRFEHFWTHEQHERKRVIDYVCVDDKIKRWIWNAEARDIPDLGSDHRAVWITLRIEARAIKKAGPRGK